MEKLENVKKTNKTLKVLVLILLIIIIILSVRAYLVKKYYKEHKYRGPYTVSQEKYFFNAQFVKYEGVKKGSALRGLSASVDSSNSEESNPCVELVLPGVDSTKELKATTDYKVTLFYDNDGYINKITVESKQEEIVKDEETLNSIANFNNQFKEYIGDNKTTEEAESLRKVINTSNKKYTDHIVKINGFDAEQITPYSGDDLLYLYASYDKDGYICNINIWYKN